MRLIRNFENTLKNHRLVQRGDSVLLAVSGGVDSVVMFDLFRKIQERWDLSLAVVHVNHGLRKRTAMRDETFVRGLAKQAGFRCYTVQCDVPMKARQKGISIEVAGREARFQSFNRLMKRIGFDKTALGHQANDQAETILYHLLKGSGIRGIRGIPPKRGRFIHPLLSLSRSEVEDYAREFKLMHVEDASNHSRKYTRNRLRWDVLPCLERAVGGPVVGTICRTGAGMGEVEEFVTEVSNRARALVLQEHPGGEIVLDIGPFLHYFTTIRKTILIQVLEGFFPLSKPVDFHLIERIHQLAVSGKSGATIDCGQGMTAVRSRNTIAFHRSMPAIRSRTVRIDEAVLLEEQALCFRSHLFPHANQTIEFSGDGRREYLDYDTLPLPLRIRSLRPGDKFMPLGMENKKKVQDFFVDEQVPNYRRRSVPLLVGQDEIIWIAGYRIDHRYRLTEDTKRVLRVEIESIQR